MNPKLKLGVIGGMGARAGCNFIQKVIDYSPAIVDQDFVEFILHNNSQVPDRTRAIVYNESSSLPHLLNSINLFNENSVRVIVSACVTSYYYFEEMKKHTSARILSPMEAVREELLRKYPGVRKAGLLATSGTLSARLFEKALEPFGIEVVVLESHDMENYLMKSIYMKNGLKSAEISNEARALLYACVPKLKVRGAQAIIAGCTEVPLALNQSLLDIPFIDTIDLLAKKTVSYCYQQELVSEPALLDADPMTTF